MDPISQGFLGASISQSLSKKSEIKSAAIIGFIAGMAADLDVFLNLHLEKLLRVVYHRHFTHSVVFIPIFALIVALFLHVFFKRSLSFKKTYFYSIFAYASHGLLDACTSYGTALYWPLSNERVSWDIISIIDPLFTVPLAFMLFLSLKKSNIAFARISFLWCFIALGFGFFQKERAYKVVLQEIRKRNHISERLLVKPSGFNTFNWRTVYEYKDHYYVDGVINKLSSRFVKGSFIKKLNINSLNLKAKQLEGVRLFSWFTQNWLALAPNNSKIIIDLRYGYPFASLQSIWGIEINPSSKEYPQYHSLMRKNFKDLYD